MRARQQLTARWRIHLALRALFQREMGPPRPERQWALDRVNGPEFAPRHQAPARLCRRERAARHAVRSNWVVSEQRLDWPLPLPLPVTAAVRCSGPTAVWTSHSSLLSSTNHKRVSTIDSHMTTQHCSNHLLLSSRDSTASRSHRVRQHSPKRTQNV
jgi:hypothetical protein